MSNVNNIAHSFEVENEERREREQIKQNIIKRYDVNQVEEMFPVGSPEVIDPYSGKSIYTPNENARDEGTEDVEPEYEEESFDEAESDEERAKKEEEARLAEEIYQRLMSEAAADEQAKQAEIEALLREQEATSEDFNEATGSYSGLYGKKPMNDSEAEALADIMNSNSSYTKSIEDLFNENKN